MYRKKIYKGYFTIPAVLIYTLLFMVPVVLNFYYSFTNWNAIKMTGETAKASVTIGRNEGISYRPSCREYGNS